MLQEGTEETERQKVSGPDVLNETWSPSSDVRRRRGPEAREIRIKIKIV